MKPKIVVTPETYKKVKQWHDEGKKVYRMTCANLGCLADLYTTHDVKKEPMWCPRCRTMGGGFFDVKGTVTPDMLEPKEIKPVKVKIKDISIEVTEPPSWASCMCDNLVNLRMTIGGKKGHWRPIDMPYNVYAETVKEFSRTIKMLEKSIEDGTFFDDEENFYMIASVCQKYNYILVRGH
ncbi:MAG: hypothetical protein MUP55_00730 [Candidatus Aenigmarchaeota archaeon]|nr:hypothetical protein [Candidatus Aenigmarchaeota archaeon]